MPRTSRKAKEKAAESWLTTLTLHINLQKGSFAPTFRTTLSAPKMHKICCSCPKLPHLWPSDDHPIGSVPDLPPRATITPRFVFRSSQKVERAKKIYGLANKHRGSQYSRKWMRQLIKDLSKLCEGKSNLNLSREEETPNPRPFRSKLVDNGIVSEELRSKISSYLSPTEVRENGMGYIYILRSIHGHSTQAELKIGFSKYHPEHRAHELGRCLTRPEVVGHTPLLPHAKRIESIIRAELVSCRKVQFCRQCQRNHREWFTISNIDAREVVMR